jgi:hypothetical protein
MSIPQILSGAFPPKTPVYGVTGVVSEAFAVRQVQTRNGQRAVMDLWISDPATGSRIKAAWWAPTVQSPQQITNAQVYITAKQDGKGASVDHNTYNGQTTIPLQVNAGCLSITGGAAGGFAAPPPAQGYQPSPQQPGYQTAPGSSATPPQQAAFTPPQQGVIPPVMSDRQVLNLSRRYIDFFTQALPGGDERALATMVATMVIGATQGRFTIDPNLDVAALLQEQGSDDIPF